MGRSVRLLKRNPSTTVLWGSMDESWMMAHKGPSSTTGALTVGEMASGRYLILCPNRKGKENKVQYVKPWCKRQFPGGQALCESCELTQYAVGMLGYTQLVSSNS